MFRNIVLGLAFVLSGCMETTNTSFKGPSGAAVNTAKCNGSSTACLQKASQTCAGPYQVLDSESHAGGIITDVTGPGPSTWYSMTYHCGPSDGKLPTFAFRGPQYVEPPPPVVVNNNNTPTPSAGTMPPPTRCQSMRVGMSVQTVCN
jgi:hypothetical protein